MQIRQLLPKERNTRIINFSWLIVGIYQSQLVFLSRIAGRIPGPAKLLSIPRRLSRLLANPANRVWEWYGPVAIQWLEAQFHHRGEIHIIIDGTKIGFGYQLLIVSLAYRRLAIPIAWIWVKQARDHSGSVKQLALLAYVRSLLRRGAAVFLVGDCELGSVEVLRQFDKWHWFYVLRKKTDTCIWLHEKRDCKTLGSYIQNPGQSIWLGNGYLTKKEIYQVNLLVHWKICEKESWCLTTNLPDIPMTLKY